MSFNIVRQSSASSHVTSHGIFFLRIVINSSLADIVLIFRRQNSELFLFKLAYMCIEFHLFEIYNISSVLSDLLLLEYLSCSCFAICMVIARSTRRGP